MQIFKDAYCLLNEGDTPPLYKGKYDLYHKSPLGSFYVSSRNASRKKTTSCNKMIYDAVLIFRILFKEGNQNIYFFSSSYEGRIHFNEELSSYFGMEEFSFLLKGNILYLDTPKEENYFSSVEGYTLIFLCLFAEYAYKIHYFREYHDNVIRYLKESALLDFIKCAEEFYQDNKNTDYQFFFQKTELSLKGVSVMETLKNEIDNMDKEEKAPEKITEFDKTEFKEEYLEKIPHSGKEVSLPEELKDICNAIREGDCISYLQYGPSGTGKTTNVKLICEKIGLPLMQVINCSDSLDELVLGKFVPSEGDGRIVFMESMFTKAIRDGGAVVLEEINFGRPQYLSFLNSLLDDNGFVRLDNGHEVKRHKNFRLFATMNFSYLGTNELNQALYNRFNIIQEIPDLSLEKVKTMLLARVPSCKDYILQIMNVYEEIREEIKKSESEYVISPRTLEMWARLGKYSGYVRAAESTLVSIAKEDDVFKDVIRGIVARYEW